MALVRLQDDEVYRFMLASPLAFADFENPTTAELNANPTNDPNGLILNLTCALDTGSSQFDLDDPDLDDSLTFCQTAGSGEAMEYSATIVFAYNMAKQVWNDASSTDAIDGFNTANLAHANLLWRGVEYIAIMSVGKAGATAFAIDDRVKMASVATDVATADVATGSPVVLTQTFAKRSDINWNFKLAA